MTLHVLLSFYFPLLNKTGRLEGAEVEYFHKSKISFSWGQALLMGTGCSGCSSELVLSFFRLLEADFSFIFTLRTWSFWRENSQVHRPPKIVPLESLTQGCSQWASINLSIIVNVPTSTGPSHELLPVSCFQSAVMLCIHLSVFLLFKVAGCPVTLIFWEI